VANRVDLRLGLTAHYFTARDLTHCSIHGEPYGESTGKCLECVLDRSQSRQRQEESPMTESYMIGEADATA
jgi:hypothetical protein